jgi:sec-independent protein translocase protein TatA
MGLSLGHLFLVLVIVLLVFGAKRVPEIMKDLAKGYKAFSDGVQEDVSQTPADQAENQNPPFKHLEQTGAPSVPLAIQAQKETSVSLPVQDQGTPSLSFDQRHTPTSAQIPLGSTVHQEAPSASKTVDHTHTADQAPFGHTAYAASTRIDSQGAEEQHTSGPGAQDAHAHQTNPIDMGFSIRNAPSLEDISAEAIDEAPHAPLRKS